MKKVFSLLITLVMLISTAVVPVSAEGTTTLSGTGIETDPYIIATADDLELARDLINANANGEASAYYAVTANIDLENEEWTPIGASGATAFSGHFDGRGHVVKNIKIEIADNDDYDNTFGTTEPALGFFGRVITYGTEVSNLGLENVTITNNAQWSSSSKERKINGIGGFVGSANNNATFTNCYVKNANLAHNATATPAGVGSFVGTYANNQTPTFINCYVYGATLHSSCNSGDWVGGFASSKGTQYTRCSFENCYVADVTVTGRTREKSDVYGFTGKGEKATTATGCYSELDDFDGDNTTYAASGAKGYESTRTLGTVGMTKAGLVEAMIAVGYTTDATVNNGYPCLAWEVPEVEAWNGIAATSFVAGTGTAADPYQITTAAELKLASDMTNDTTINGQWSGNFYFKLMNDIDYENNAWIPMGISNVNGSYTFRGGFDGNNHVVKNLKIDYDCSDSGLGNIAIPRYMGFFGYAQKAEIKNLGIDNIQITIVNPSSSGNRAQNIGGFAGRLSGSTVSNCYVKNSTVSQSSDSTETSGVAGFVHYTSMSGGIATTVQNCYVYNVDLKSGYDRAQCGFVTKAEGNTVFTNCYADAEALREVNTHYPSYAFGYTGATGTAYTEGTTATISNCLSTMSDSNATSTASFGDGGQSVSDIANAFKDLEGWQDGENINAGLPALSWETAPVAEVVAPYVVKTVSLTKNTITLDVNKAVTGAKLYVATYDADDRLVAAEAVDAAATVTTTIGYDGAAKVKVFIWNGVTPVIDAVVKDLY